MTTQAFNLLLTMTLLSFNLKKANQNTRSNLSLLSAEEDDPANTLLM
jgi:hypothetical protein